MSTWQGGSAFNSRRWGLFEIGSPRRGAAMTLNPFRLYRRLRRLERQAIEEAQHLRRRHGAGALAHAEQQLARPDLTSWGRLVLRRAIRLLRSTA